MKQPIYYNKNGFSPVDAMKKGLISKEEYIGFLKGNIIKYTIRCDKKDNPITDIDKAIHYLTMLQEEFSE